MSVFYQQILSYYILHYGRVYMYVFLIISRE